MHVPNRILRPQASRGKKVRRLKLSAQVEVTCVSTKGMPSTQADRRNPWKGDTVELEVGVTFKRNLRRGRYYRMCSTE